MDETGIHQSLLEIQGNLKEVRDLVIQVALINQQISGMVEESRNTREDLQEHEHRLRSLEQLKTAIHALADLTDRINTLDDQVMEHRDQAHQRIQSLAMLVDRNGSLNRIIERVVWIVLTAILAAWASGVLQRISWT